jgi:leader peptidase (prepilin peptidase)/N-methyltransferase
MECGHRLEVLDLFPIVSYILLNGKCRYCGSKVSIQYPIVELANAVLYVILFYKFYFTLYFFSWAFFVSWLLVIFVIDLKSKIIPNKLNLAGFIIIVILKMIESITVSSFTPLLDAGLGMLVGAVPLIIIIVFSHGGMGAGDMKLMAVIGLWLGLKLTYLTLVIGIIIAAIVAIGLIIIKKKSLKSSIAFGPFLTTAAFVALMWGEVVFKFIF